MTDSTIRYFMKGKITILFVPCFCILIGNAQSNRNYTGLLKSNIKTFFQLSFNSGNISGTYFYETKGIDIKLTGTQNGDSLEMYELDDAGKRTARMYGKLQGKTFTGKWQSLVSKTILPLTLQQTTNQAAALPSVIEGTYITAAVDEETGDSGRCVISIIITHEKGDYYYRLQSDKRKVQGKVHFYRSQDEKNPYIIFEGLTCDEGCTKTEGLFYENTIAIQNYGNAMNEYTKLGECDRKYVYLQKQ